MTQYHYNSTDLGKPVPLSEKEEFLLKPSKTFFVSIPEPEAVTAYE